MQDIINRIWAVDWSRWSGPTLSALRILLILAVAWIAISVLDRMVSVLRSRLAGRLDGAEGVRRAETLSRVIRYLIGVIVGAIAVMLVLGEVGVSLAPILGAAGVVGLAIGFGAQSLVKDYFTGFFVLFEDQIRTGDVVKIADHSGLVEDITLRHVRLRDYDGNVHYIPNNLITTVTNMSRNFAQAVVDIGVAYRENVDEVFEVMKAVGAGMRNDVVFGPKILGELEIAGVEQLGDSAVVLRSRFKTVALEQWTIKREYLRRLKAAFDEAGIELPFPHVTVYAGADKSGRAPAMPLSISGEGLSQAAAAN
jgi:moderate conductance mechanosensitive channel